MELGLSVKDNGSGGHIWFDINYLNLTNNIFHLKHKKSMVPVLFTSADEIVEKYHGVSR